MYKIIKVLSKTIRSYIIDVSFIS